MYVYASIKRIKGNFKKFESFNFTEIFETPAQLKTEIQKMQ